MSKLYDELEALAEEADDEVRDALRRAADTQAPDAIAQAVSTFSRVDRDFRANIRDEAIALAEIRRRVNVTG